MLASELLTTASGLSEQNRKIKNEALSAIRKALHETIVYYKRIKSGDDRDLNIENKLSQYWGEASIPVSHLDKHFAEICKTKAEYWLIPDQYSNEDLAELNIELFSVKERYDKMLLE